MDFFFRKILAAVLLLKDSIAECFPMNFENLLKALSVECVCFFRPSQSSCSTSQIHFDNCLCTALPEEVNMWHVKPISRVEVFQKVSMVKSSFQRGTG